MTYTPPTIEELNDTIAKERKRANDAWAAAQMEREVAEAYKADALRYRWLNKQHNFMVYIEDAEETRTNVRLRCGLPLDEWIDNRIAEERHDTTAGGA